MNTLSAIAPALVDAAARGAIVLLIALGITHLMRRRSAAARHLVWVGAIIVQLLLPVFALWGPRWDVAVPAPVASVSPVTIPERVVDGAPSARIEETTFAPSTEVKAQATTTLPSPAEPAKAPFTRGQVLLFIWAAGAAIVLMRLAAGTAIVARLARRGNRVDDGNWLSLAQRLSTSLQIDRPLTLLRGTKLGVPVTWGIVYPVVLLPDDSDSWPEERRKFVLVHEMAHVKRLDALTQLAGQLALALFWFDPLVWIANRRMQMEREHACDDYVINHGTAPSTYAEELLSMVRTLGTSDKSSQPAFAALAMARRSEFEGRMLSILDPVLERHPLSKVRTLASALAALVLVVPLAALHPYQRAAGVVTAMTPPRPSPVPTAPTAPAKPELTDEFPESFKISIQPATPKDTGRSLAESAAILDAKAQKLAEANAQLAKKTTGMARKASCDNIQLGGAKQGTSTHIHATDDNSGNDIIDFLTFNSSRCASATIIGKLRYAPNEEDVLEMPFGSHATFRQRSDADDRELTLLRLQDGSIQRMYRRNGADAAWNDDGRRWFATYLPSVLMEAGINVGPRVARWRAEGGVNKVLSLIPTLAGSGAKRSHYEALLSDGSLSGDDLDRVVRSASTSITSSGDLRAILMKAQPNVRLSRQGISALEAALTSMTSSGDKAAVLEAYGKTDDREMLLAVMRAAATIASSGDRARLFQVLGARYLSKNDRALESVYFEQVSRLPSSGDLHSVLMMALPYGANSPFVTRSIIESVRKMASSGDRSAVLINMVSQNIVTTRELRDRFFEVAAEIPSEADRARVLQVAARLMQ